MDLNSFRGVMEIVGMIGFLIYNVYQAQRYIDAQKNHISVQQNIINALIETVKNYDNSPTTIAAIQGATQNVPPEFFNQVISALTTSKLFVPDELKGLTDILSKFFKDIEVTKSTPPSNQATP